MTKRICLWSGPRNISTALMYSFAQRHDTTVVDEPLYAYYLSTTAAQTYHPGAAEVIAAQENDGAKVIRDVILGDYPTPLVFFKHMTHHLINLDWSFLDQTINVLLTRDPKEMLPSYAANVAQPSLGDTDYADHLKLLNYLQSRGQTPPILDAKQVLLDPRGVLAQLCAQIAIPFDEAMLSWAAGARPEDGIWAKYWYEAVHLSTGFQPYQPKTTPFPEHLKPLLAECQPYYERLAAFAIRADRKIKS
jgi:Sulfotransferase domain